MTKMCRRTWITPHSWQWYVFVQIHWMLRILRFFLFVSVNNTIRFAWMNRSPISYMDADSTGVWKYSEIYDGLHTIPIQYIVIIAAHRWRWDRKTHTHIHWKSPKRDRRLLKCIHFVCCLGTFISSYYSTDCVLKWEAQSYKCRCARLRTSEREKPPKPPLTVSVREKIFRDRQKMCSDRCCCRCWRRCRRHVVDDVKWLNYFRTKFKIIISSRKQNLHTIVDLFANRWWIFVGCAICVVSTQSLTISLWSVAELVRSFVCAYSRSQILEQQSMPIHHCLHIRHSRLGYWWHNSDSAMERMTPTNRLHDRFRDPIVWCKNFHNI